MKLLGGGGAASDSSSKTVAVLPFENLGSSDDAYFADGMVEELRDKLARLAQLTVTASASSDLYRGTSKTATEIARELRVDQVLTGKVRWATGNDGARQVRVAAELIDGSTGKVTWRDTFDADMANAFEIQGRIATKVAAALGTLLAPREAENLAGRPTQNAEAHEIFLKAAAITAQGMQGYRARIVLLEQVVALDPGFARAWALLTANLSAQYAEGTGDPAIARRAREALDRTMALASDSAGAHVIAAEYHTNVAHDRDSARASIERALELAPKDAWVLSSSAGYDLSDGNYQQMFEKLTRAREINPLSRTVIASLIEAQMLTGRVDEAAATTNELMALEPTAYIQMQGILFARLAAGDIEGARAAVREFLSRVPASELVTFFAGYQELAFLLPDDAVALLFRMSPAAFDDDLAWWGQTLAMAADQRGDRTRARAYADSGLAVALQQVEATPDDPQLRILYAVMLGYTGMNDEAVRQRDRAVAALTADYPPRSITYVHLQAARVDLALGKNDAALDQIEIALAGEGYVTPGYLKADPMFEPLKGNPRFEQLVAGGLSVPVD